MDFDQLSSSTAHINILPTHFCGRLSDQTIIWFLLSPPLRQMLAVFLLRPQAICTFKFIYEDWITVTLPLLPWQHISLCSCPFRILSQRSPLHVFACHLFPPPSLLSSIGYKHLVFMKAACGLPRLTYLCLLPTLLSLVGFRYQPSLPFCHLSSWALLCFSAS